MNKTYATIQLGGEQRNAERLGALISWVVSNHLLEPVLERSNSTAVARVRMQDLTGPEFLTTVLHGEFNSAHLNEEGQGFIEKYFVSGRFDEDYDSCQYAGENEWHRYDEVSPKISAAYRGYTMPGPGRKAMAKILKFPFGGKKS